MKESTEVFYSENSWSWLSSASSAIVFAPGSPSLPVIVAVSLKLFLNLPDALVRAIISYFPLYERRDLLAFKLDKRLFLFQTDLHAELMIEQYIDTFIHIMTLASPYNQAEALSMLAQYPLLVKKLISMQRKMDNSAVARQFKQPISAYEYAWCINDIEMCHILEQHMSEKTKNEILFKCEARAVEKFMYLITREGEDNQNKAEAMLKQYPHLVAELISSEIDTRDLTRHFIKPMSAYAYAYWSGDTRMRAMLNKYVFEDETLLSKVYQQCNAIAEVGIDFERLSNDGKPIPNSTVSHSKHFDYQPLIEAYDDYNAEAFRLIDSSKLTNEDDWEYAKELCLKIGEQWTKMPVCGMQEMCLPSQINGLETLNWGGILALPSIERSLRVLKNESNEYEYLATRGLVNSKFGSSISIYRSMQGAVCGSLRRWQVNQDVVSINSMLKLRTDKDLKRTLVDLKWAAPSSLLSL